MSVNSKRTQERLSGNVMTADDVAEYLKISRESAVRLFKRKAIRATKVGILWRCLRTDVDRFMEQT